MPILQKYCLLLAIFPIQYECSRSFRFMLEIFPKNRQYFREICFIAIIPFNYCTTVVLLVWTSVEHSLQCMHARKKMHCFDTAEIGSSLRSHDE